MQAHLYASKSNRIVNQSFQRARNASEGQYTLSDVNIALTMAQMLRNGVPARLSSSNWPAESWIADEDQTLALLVAFLKEVGRLDEIWWPQIASIVFPDRHLDSAQLRWLTAEKAAKILAKALHSGCTQTAVTLDMHALPFLILYHLLLQMRGQAPLQAYTDACVISNRDPAQMPWAGSTEAAVCAAFPVFHSGCIYEYLWNETDDLKWAAQNGTFTLSSYLLRPQLPKSTYMRAGQQGIYVFGHAGYRSSSGYTPSRGEDDATNMSGDDYPSSSDESLGDGAVRHSMENCSIRE
ncbi:hypothetical protein WJX75_006324 [Coccomyxa subellipsoidea]|uniref:Uncharacterized protein n=1 Tax=Coccomyxa subellipsoidea TaxID=248742 RepID=A0ABR2YCB2_9CHLO